MMQNWCPGNPSNTGHEPAHELAKKKDETLETYTFMGFSPDDGQAIDLHICKHCSLVYGRPAPVKPEEKPAEVAAE